MSLIACQRGTASVEIVVMLPVFILLLLGVMHMHRLGLAQQEAKSAARACAYYYAVNGCTDKAAGNAICKDVVVGKAGAVDEANAGTEQENEANSWIDEANGWPLLGPMLQQLFGEGSRARAEREAGKFLGNENSKVSGRFYMVCNTVAESWTEKVDQLLCDAANNFGVDVMPGCK